MHEPSLKLSSTPSSRNARHRRCPTKFNKDASPLLGKLSKRCLTIPDWRWVMRQRACWASCFGTSGLPPHADGALCLEPLLCLAARKYDELSRESREHVLKTWLGHRHGILHVPQNRKAFLQQRILPNHAAHEVYIAKSDVEEPPWYIMAIWPLAWSLRILVMT